MAKRWYVLQTKFGKEDETINALRSKKFKVFYPCYQKMLKENGKRVLKTLPLFPSYVFVQFDIKRHPRWRSVVHVRGVHALMGCVDDFVPPLPRGCVEELMARADRNGVIQIEKAVEKILQFVPNMKLLIRGEQYRGLIATYCSHTEKRVTLLLTLLNRRIQVILPVEAIAPLPEYDF